MAKVPSSTIITVDYGAKKTSVFDRLGSKSSSKQLAEGRKIKLIPLVREPSIQEKIGTLTSSKGKMKKSRHNKKSKDKHRRALGANSLKTEDTPDIECLDLGDLEGADEKFLQKRRLELQRELRLQLKREKKSRPKKVKKTVVISSDSSDSSSESSSSSSSSSTSSSYAPKKGSKKRKLSESSDSDASPQKKRKSVTPPPPPKSKVDLNKHSQSPRRDADKKTIASKRSVSPHKPPKVITRKRSRPRSRSKSRGKSPKHRPREHTPRRAVRSPPQHRPRSWGRHSPPRPRVGGLEKGGKILPVKLSAYAKEMKSTSTRRSSSRSREEREKDNERSREKKRREEKAREAERREREAERIKREVDRQKDRDKEAICRSKERDRQRERERSDRRGRELERKELRKPESKNDLPSLLDIRTEVPARDAGQRGWEERRSRRSEDRFDYRRGRNEGESSNDRSETLWDDRESVRPHSPPSKWPRDARDSKPSEPKWAGGRREPIRDRDHFVPRRQSPNWRNDQPGKGHEDDATFSKNTHEQPVKEPSSAPVGADASADLEDLSDISDDADEILNKEEVAAPLPSSGDASQPSSLLPVTITQSNSDFFFDSRRPLLECLGDRGLDFEEISDEELEEDAKIGKGIMDVLGADWASLLADRPKKAAVVEKATSARRRWCADAIIARIGISRRLAGDEFSDSLLLHRNDKSNNEMEVESDKVINEPSEFLDPLPAVHSYKAAIAEPSAIQQFINPISKHALSARTDLTIRRVLCCFSAKEPVQMGSCDGGFKMAAA